MASLAEQLRNLELLDLISLQDSDPNPNYAFKHIFTQESVYHSLLLSDRRQLHRQVGEALENLYLHGHGSSDSKDMNEMDLLLAHHFEQGNETQRAIKYLKRAARQAKATYANQEALSLYTRIFDLLGESDFQRQWDILAEHEQILSRIGQREAQANDLDHMCQLAEFTGDKLRLALTHNRRATYFDKISQYQAAGEAAQLGLNLAHQLKNERVEAESLNLLAWAAWRRFDYQQVKAYAHEALNALHITGDPINRINSLLHLGKASYRLGQYDSALDYIHAAKDLASFNDNPDNEAGTLLILGWIYQRLGDYDVAEHNLKVKLEKHRLTGDRYGEATALSHLGWVAYDQEDFHKGLSYCQEALVTSEAIGDRANQAYSLGGLALNYEGLQQYPQAVEYYHQALTLHRQIGTTTLIIFDQARLAHLAMKRQDLASARQYMTEVVAWIQAGKAQQFWDPWSIYLSAYQVLAALGETETAHQFLTEAHTVLTQRAAEISDEILRKRFLTEVKVNREIIAAWQTM